MNPGGQPSPAPQPARRGRPPGTVALTEEIAQKIVDYTKAGAFDYVAAEAAGISARTFRDWIARGEGTHPTRASTPKLRRFAQRVAQAKAEARTSAEVRVHRDQPASWLAHAARSKPDREGWTTPSVVPGEEGTGVTSFEERIAEWDRQAAERDRQAATSATSDCPDADCACPFHQRRYVDELERSRRSHSD